MTHLHICTCYIISTLVLTTFIYYIMSMGLQNTIKVNRLQGEFNEMQHTLSMQPPEVGAAETMSGKEQCCCDTGSGRHCVSKMVELAVKRKLAHITDDLYTMKKEIVTKACCLSSTVTGKNVTSNSGGQSAKPAGESRADYASEELGARIVDVDAIPVDETNLVQSVLGLDFSANPPKNMIRPGLVPGNCFAFKGAKASISVYLAFEIFVETIAISHVAKELTPNESASSAPKDFSVFGIPTKPGGNYGDKVPCGQFKYDNSPKVRTQEYKIMSKHKFAMLRLMFTSNHGNPNYTCIYRLQVFGRTQ